MRTLLIAALLAASTAHAETYICQKESATGLMTFNAEEEFAPLDHAGVKQHVFAVKKIDNTKYELRFTDGELISECNVFDIKLDGAILCHTTAGFFQLEPYVGKYVKTDVGVKLRSTKPNDLVVFGMSGGKCDLFEE